MRTRFFLRSAALALLTGVLSQGCASQRKSAQSSETYPNSTNRADLTGSYIPQDINRNGPVTNGKNDVRVIDRSDINNSGGADVRQTLRELGVTH